MDLKECIIAHLKECGLKMVGRHSNNKAKLLRFKKNRTKYTIVLDYDTCMVHIWKEERKTKPRTSPHHKVPIVRGGTKLPSKPLIVNLHDPNSLKRISNFV